MKRLLLPLLLWLFVSSQLFVSGEARAVDPVENLRAKIAAARQAAPPPRGAAPAPAAAQREGEIARAQAAAKDAGLNIWPTQGMASAYLSHAEPGKWLVMKDSFIPVFRYKVVEDGKAVVFEDAPGTTCGVIYFPSGDGQPVITPVVLGGTPTTVVTTDTDKQPPKPPKPVQTDNPFPATGKYLLITYEKGAGGLTRTQEIIVTSAQFRNYLDDNGYKYQFPDNDFKSQELRNAMWPETWIKAYEIAVGKGSDEKAWMILSVDGKYTSEALPQTLEEMMALLKKYGG